MGKEEVRFTLAEDWQGVGRAGEVMTMALAPSDVHDPTELPSYLAGYSNAKFRADEASFPVLVDKDNDKRRDFSSDNTFQLVKVKASTEASPPEVTIGSSLTEFKVVDRFVGSFIPDIVEQQAAPNYSPRQRSMRRCANAIQMDREVDVWTLLTTAGSWNAANREALGAAAKWNGGATANPILAIQTRIEASAQPVTDIFFDTMVAHAFLRHALVRDHMRQMLGDRGVDAAAASVADAARAATSVDFTIPGLPPFHVVGAKYLNETTSTLDYILGTSYCVLVSNPVGVPQDGEEIATSITFRRRGAAGVGYETREFRVEGRGPKGGTMVVVSQADIAQVTSSISGGLISGCIQ